ncbi:MAG: Rieske 2Fe-2S domain-containing protein [Burkholderiales bacterium]|nr:Rieske 2Fe-2S domain-containing protein [Burkholderiales bacterium]
MAAAALIRIGASADLVDGGRGLRFDASVGDRAVTGFAVRYRGTVVGYLNQCAHVAMELDWQPGMFFDSDGEGDVLVCATHGALYEPATGRCAGGPCAGRGGLRRLQMIERDGAIYWQPDDVVRAPLTARRPAG